MKSTRKIMVALAVAIPAVAVAQTAMAQVTHGAAALGAAAHRSVIVDDAIDIKVHGEFGRNGARTGGFARDDAARRGTIAWAGPVQASSSCRHTTDASRRQGFRDICPH